MLTITVQGPLEERLKRAAESSNSDPQAVARQVLDEHLPTPAANANQTTLDLLSNWEKDEQTIDAAELSRRQAEGEQLMKNLAENRVASEGPSARKLWP